MRSRIVEYIVEYGKLPTGYQQEIMDYSWGFTYGFRPILPQILEALFVRVGMLFTADATADAFGLLFVGRLSSVLCGLVYAGYVRAIAKKLFAVPRIQWLFTLLAVCLPQAAFLFTYLNCDSMALMATAMILWYHDIVFVTFFFRLLELGRGPGAKPGAFVLPVPPSRDEKSGEPQRFEDDGGGGLARGWAGPFHARGRKGRTGGRAKGRG